jgi:hypothetical protein
MVDDFDSFAEHEADRPGDGDEAQRVVADVQD